MTHQSDQTILLVEDEAIIAVIHKKILSKYGFDVITADTGEKAIEIIELNHDIDLVLMDINLGDGIDGTKAAEEILKIRNIPLVFLSSHTEPEVVNKTEGITSYGYIVKNSGETVLIAAIKMAFRLYEANEQLRLQAMVLDQIDDRVTVTDLSGNITYVNNAEVISMGYSRDELIGAATEKYGENSDAGATQREILEETLKTGHWRGEVVNYSADGKEIIMDCRTQVIYDSRRNPFALCGVATDITEKKRTEDAIRKSEEKYRMLVQSTNSIILRWKRDGEILFMNDFGLRFFGFDKDELIGKSVVGTIVPVLETESGINLPELMNRLFDNNELYVRNINQNVTREGKTVWVSWTNNVVNDDNGIPVEMFSVGQDVTDHKIAEQIIKNNNQELAELNSELHKKNMLLQEQEREYRTLFENTGSGIIVIEEDTTISLANDIFAARLGYTRDEIENVKKWTELVHEDDLNRMLKQHRLRRDDPDKADSSYEFRFKARSGEYMDTLLFISMLPGTSRSIASLIDITDNKTAIESAERYRMKLEAAYEELEATNEEMEASMQELADTSRDLEESEAKFRSLAESGPVAIMMYQDDKWIYANPAAEKMSGYSKEELLDMNFWDFVAPEHQGKVKDTGQVRQRNLKSDPDYEFKIISKEGLEKWVHLYGSTVIHMGKPAGLIAVIDITEWKRAEDELSLLLQEKKLLLKETHHRVKNNMNTIYGLLYMQAEEVKDPVSKNVIMEAASRIQSMMLLYNRLYRSIEVHELNINDYLPALIDEIVKIFNSPVPVKSHIKIEDIVINSKTISVLGIIINELITNSMKYAFGNVSEGLIRLSVTAKDKKVTFIYSDNGPGLPESVNFDNSTGFGMQLIDMMVKQLNGTVEIIRDKGTEIVIQFDIE